MPGETPGQRSLVGYSSQGCKRVGCIQYNNRIQHKDFLCSVRVMSDSFQPHELQHASLPCPSLFPEVTQTPVHWVSDAIQPPHPLSLPSLLVLSLSQHQCLFQWVGSLHQVAKVLELSFSISRKQILKKSVYMYTNNWLTMLSSRKYTTLWINYTPIKFLKQIIKLRSSPQFHKKMKASSFHILKSKQNCYSPSQVPLFATPWTVAHQALISMGF